MIDLHDILTAQLSGIAEYKNEKEIWCKSVYKHTTVEIIDVEKQKYIIRIYEGSSRDRKVWEFNYLNGKRHGKGISYSAFDGHIICEYDFIEGKVQYNDI